MANMVREELKAEIPEAPATFLWVHVRGMVKERGLGFRV